MRFTLPARLRALPVEPVELLLSVAALLFAVQFGNPGFSTFNSAPGFRAMASLGLAEADWAALFLLMAAGSFAGMLGHWRWLRLAASAVAIVVWGFIAMMFFRGNPYGTGWIGVGLYLVKAMWVFVHVASRRQSVPS